MCVLLSFWGPLERRPKACPTRGLNLNDACHWRCCPEQYENISGMRVAWDGPILAGLETGIRATEDFRLEGNCVSMAVCRQPVTAIKHATYFTAYIRPACLSTPSSPSKVDDRPIPSLGSR